MTKLIVSAMILVSLIGLAGMKSPSDPATWSDKKVERWFAKGEWTAGWKINPDPSINKRELAVSYFKNRERWDKAFTYLKNTDFTKLATKRYDIDGDNLFATISEYKTKDPETTNFEAHRKYIDIQYVISGEEMMNVTPLSTLKEVVTPYDESKDIEFLTVSNIVNHKASPSNFFIFFPDDAHRPGIKVGDNLPVRKVVIKLRVQ